MKIRRNVTTLRVSAIAVHSALALMGAAQAQSQAPLDPALIELTQPKNSLEIGLGGTGAGRYSAKANEYSGLRSTHEYVIGHLDLRGGGSYDGDDTTRWSLSGSKLGTQSPEIGISYAVQGRFRLRLSFDQLLRNTSDSYQTPYQGAGTERFTLPANWKPPLVPQLSATARDARGLAPEVTGTSAIVGGTVRAPVPAVSNAIQAADLPAFQKVDLFTRRARYGIGFDQQIDTNWSLSAGITHEHKDGLKATPVHTSVTGDASAVLPAPIDQDDDQLHLGVAYTGAKFQFALDYEGSSFRNNVHELIWDYWSSAPVASGPGSSSTPPSNLFNKLSLSGSYRVADATKLVGNLAYSRGTQNDPYAQDASSVATSPVVPVSSAHAEVVNESASLRALHKLSPDLGLTATYKYDLRDNRTPVNTYVYNDNNSTPAGTSPFASAILFPGADLTKFGTLININANTPYSRRSNQIALEGDYKLTPDQHLKGGWQTQKIDRYCTGSWINCADAPHSTEHTLHGDWFGELGESVSARFGASTARRKVTYDENAFLAVVPMARQTLDPTTAGYPAGTTAYDALVALGLTGYGPVSGRLPVGGALAAFYFTNNSALRQLYYGNHNRFSELLGLRRYNQAQRQRDKLHSSVDWQASERLTLQGGIEFDDDRYTDSVYGLERMNSWAVNLDGHYAVADDLSIGLFGSYEGRRVRTAGNTYVDNATPTAAQAAQTVVGGCYANNGDRLSNAKIDPCLNWATRSVDLTATVGANFTVSRLMAGKLDLSGSAVYSQARMGVGVSGGAYVVNPYAGVAGNPTSTIGAYYIPATALPTDVVKSLDLRVGAVFRFNDLQALHAVYGYQRLASSDWSLQGLQPGGAQQFLPTYEKAPNYKVNSIGLAYVVSFR
jgi:MtrB/PioB family decaheme-associated outer membrane protein